MKPTFRYTLLNDPFGDPAVSVRFIREKKRLLFDLGDIRKLTTTELHKVTDVFITHTHIDHFIGFDVLLRIVLRRDIPLNIYGPKGIIANIAGKLRGYTWNLIEDYPTIINVFGFDGRTLRHAEFSARDRFRKRIVSTVRSDGLLLESPAFTVRAVRLDHGTPCIAFRLEEGQQLNIDKDRLLKKGLSVGPWLEELKSRMRQGSVQGFLSVDGNRMAMSDLRDIVRTSRGQTLSYATDIAMSPKNISRLASFIQGSDILFCEAYFLDRDRQRAWERHHLTAKECGRTAKKAGVERLVVMHFSPKYKDSPELLIREAEEAFGKKVSY